MVWGHTDTVCTLRMLALHLLLVLLILSAVLNRHLLLLGQYLPTPNLTAKNSSTLSLSLSHTLLQNIPQVFPAGFHLLQPGAE